VASDVVYMNHFVIIIKNALSYFFSFFTYLKINQGMHFYGFLYFNLITQTHDELDFIIETLLDLKVWSFCQVCMQLGLNYIVAQGVMVS